MEPRKAVGVLALGAFLVAAAPHAETYQVTKLNIFDSPRHYPQAINISGRIVGFVQDPSDSEEVIPFIWSRTAGALPLGDANVQCSTGSNFITPRAINNRGQVAGVMYECAVVWGPVRIHVIGPGWASAINNSGYVVGARMRIADENQGFPIYYDAFSWSIAKGFQVLSPPPGFPVDGLAWASAINGTNVVVGDVEPNGLEGRFGPRAVRWDRNGVPELLSITQPADYSSARAVNDEGVTVGCVSTYSSDDRAVLWSVDGTVIPLTNQEGAPVVGCAGDINAKGQVLIEHMIWDSVNGLRDLNVLIAADPIGQNLSVIRAEAINDLGQIVVTADDTRTPQIEQLAYLLRPVK